MAATEKLYFTDSSLLQFQAKVVLVESVAGVDRVALDQTAFYPTGGGQPNDTGKLNDADVVDVIEEDDGTIFHVLKQTGHLLVGQSVEASIDKERRLDHLQQHSGQHILSQAFIQACQAETRSFHLGGQTSTIDVELQTPTDEAMRQAEEIANAIIFDNRPMRVHLLDEAGAARLPLRKESALSGLIRVIEVEDFDWSPCGGTHARQTGQIGLIAIKAFERVKSNLTRVEFVCGHRALEDYRLAHQTAVTTARLFSVGREGAPELVAKTIQENKALKKRMRELLDLAIQAEAAEMLNQAPLSGACKIIKAVFDNRDAEEIRMLAAKITGQQSAIALLATKDANGAKLVFARSANLAQNLGQSLAAACQMLGGRGGGKPEMAQGGGSDVSKLDEALQIAEEKARAETRG
jgi:alanyl-tRNA synthetase